MTPSETTLESETSDSSGSQVQSTIILHDHGDVTLLIGDSDYQQPVCVSTAILRAASPVWNAMFGYRWAESEASEIALPDDDVEAMLLVLRIAHLRFRELPQKHGLSFQALLNLAIVCDKYDLVKIVRPFLDLHCWAKPYYYPQGSASFKPEWLFVAWTFGYSDSFDALARHLAYTIKVQRSDDGSDISIETETGQEVGRNMPTDILACYATLDEIIKSKVCKITKDSNGGLIDKASECRSMILGSLVSQYFNLSIYPERKSGEDITASVRTWQSKLRSIKVHTIDSHDYSELIKYSRNRSYYDSPSSKRDHLIDHGITSHSKCGQIVFLGATAQRIASQMASPTLDSHRRYMKQQAKK